MNICSKGLKQLYHFQRVFLIADDGSYEGPVLLDVSVVLEQQTRDLRIIEIDSAGER